MDGFSIKRIIRKPYLSIIGFVIAGAMCLLLCVLSNYRSEQAKSLEKLKTEYDVTGVITDVKGAKSESLRMGERYLKFLKDEENGLGAYIKELAVSKEFTSTSENGGSLKIIGVNSDKCDTGLDKALGGEYYLSDESFFESDEYLILLPKNVYENNKNNEIQLKLTDPYGTLGMGSMETKFKVAGWHEGQETKYFIPLKKALYLSSKLSERYCTDSANFLLKDNSKIEEIYEIAQSMFEKVDPNAVNPGYALTIRDHQYKATVASFEQNIARTGYLLPIISVLGLAAGFLSGFLGTKGETRNYALMRTMGLTGKRLFITVLFEQQILSLIACVIVALVTKRPLAAAAFFGCNMIGIAIAVLKPVLAPPTKLLRDQQ